jgi:hypothetical protein
MEDWRWNTSVSNTSWLMSNMAGVLYEAGIDYHSWVPGFSPGFWWVRVALLFSFLCCVVFCLSSCIVLCVQCYQCLWIVHFYCLWFSLTFIRMRRKKLEIVVDKLKMLYIPHLVNPRQLFFKNTRSTWYWWRLNNTNIWPLCCLFFFDLRILITPLVSSNSSCLIAQF